MNQEELHREIVRDVETGLNIYTSVRFPKVKCLVMGLFGLACLVYVIATGILHFNDPVDVIGSVGLVAFFLLLGLFM